jgi:regulator of protease activity HflC (stomatin/prohibitin superfamily)
MSKQIPTIATVEREIRAASGWPMLVLNLLLLPAAAMLLLAGAGTDRGSLVALAFVFGVFAFVMLWGYFTLQPNESRVLILFGDYKGTVRRSGFFWANPFYSRSRGRSGQKNAPTGGRSGRAAAGAAVTAHVANYLSTKVSLRAHNFNSETLKVTDKRGNPVEIAAVVVWRVKNTAQAVFDVDDYKSYVQVQSESAIRSIASRYAYDNGEVNEPTLRGGADDVATALCDELQVRLAKAGVVVEEARLTHLAYAPEIAPVMLRRQQAEAIVAARHLIVQGAVGMVHTALKELDEQNIVHLDHERKAAMVSNLLVVLCGNSDASPVINTGTLYS